MGAIETKIREKITAAFTPVHLLLENESRMHSVPPGSETHFKLLLVSVRFEGLSRIARQRLINEVLREELSGGVHALSMRAMTPHEWSEAGVVETSSPPCYGGGKKSQD